MAPLLGRTVHVKTFHTGTEQHQETTVSSQPSDRQEAIEMKFPVLVLIAGVTLVGRNRNEDLREVEFQNGGIKSVNKSKV
jgi:hypothetical protein